MFGWGGLVLSMGWDGVGYVLGHFLVVWARAVYCYFTSSGGLWLGRAGVEYGVGRCLVRVGRCLLFGLVGTVFGLCWAGGAVLGMG